MAWPTHRITIDPDSPAMQGSGCGLSLLAIGYFLTALLANIGDLHNNINPLFAGLWIVTGIVVVPMTVQRWSESRRRKRLTGVERFTVVSVALAVFIGVLALVLPRVDGHVVTRRKVRCASNLRQIGQALLLYGSEYHQYPQRLETLVSTEEMPGEIFICPATNDTPAPGPTTQETLQQMRLAGHLSYVFVAGGAKPDKIKDDQVIAFDRPSNHPDDDGFNVLFGDGHVEFVGASEHGRLIEELTAKATTQP